MEKKSCQRKTQKTIINHLLLTFCLLIITSSTCNSGQVLVSGTCQTVNYIEGCLAYKSLSECEVCAYNYQKSATVCSFVGNSLANSCSTYSNDGQCAQCTKGLFLNKNSCECLDIQIPGCLQKGPTGCTNCATNYILLNEICIKSIQGCIQYSTNSSTYITTCLTCQQGYTLVNGECSDFQNYTQNCQLPFLKDQTGCCMIPNCNFFNEYGCYVCMDGFSLTVGGLCIPNTMPGCLQYASVNNCSVCEPSLYSNIGNICFPNGCTNMTNDFKCSKCDQSLGFALNNGLCQIQFCVYAGPKGCQICQSGKVKAIQRFKGCIDASQAYQLLCVNCPSTSFVNSSNQCQTKAQGCDLYVNSICSTCLNGYFYNSNLAKCIKSLPGCVYSNSVCASCSSPFTYNPNDQTCFIIGCISYASNGECLSCSSNFNLSNGACTIQNCIRANNNGCVECDTNFKLANSSCIRYDPNCIAENLYNKCIGCADGYYLSVSGTCLNQTFGCNYIQGICASCKTPFDYNPQINSCFIDGCQQYYLGGCQTCYQNYTLIYNYCKLPNCLVSSNHVCKQCDPDYIMKKDNTCVNKDQFCFKYDDNGNCLECAPKYFMSKLQQKCLARQSGCIYDNLDQCSSCMSPFKVSSQKANCYLSGCLQYNGDNCSKCIYPFQLKSGICFIRNCILNNDTSCLSCQSAYVLKDNICILQDSRCIQFNSVTGACKTCKSGYKPTASGCQFDTQNCQSWTALGNCQNCQRLYFLNPLTQCQLKDPNCLEYINGYCTKCKNLYYLFNSICNLNAQGCSVQKSINQCTACDSGYRLNNSKCVKSITQLTWNSVDMDFSSGLFNSSNKNSTLSNTSVFTTGKTNMQRLLPAIKGNYGSIFYSSMLNTSNFVNIQSTGDGWMCSKTSGQFIGVALNESQTFYAVDIKCLNRNQMTTFNIQFSDDGTTFKTNGLYQLNCPGAGVVQTIYITPVLTKLIRISPRNGMPNIKVQFYFNDKQSKNTSSANSENQTIIQKTIVSTVEAASQLLSNTCQDREMCWFSLDICQPKNVTGISIQYNSNNQGSVSQVFVDYSVDGISFTCYNQCQNMNVNNSGNVTLPLGAFGSKVRVHITKYSGVPKLQVKFNYN